MDHAAGIVVHIHHVVGIADLQPCGQIFNIVLAQHFQDGFAPANQGDFGTVALCRFDGTQYRSFGGQIAAHGIQNDLQLLHLFL